MSKIKIDYTKIKIYKLIHNDDFNNENIYIGCTTNFCSRKRQHKHCCINEKSVGYNFKVYETIRLNGGWDEWKMIEIEKYSCFSKEEAKIRERYWIDHYKSKLNI